MGQLSVFGASAGRLPYAVGIAGLLPEPLARVHPRWHTPYFRFCCSVDWPLCFCSLVQAGETLRATYQIMTDMMAIGGLLPFVYMFRRGLAFGGTLERAVGRGGQGDRARFAPWSRPPKFTRSGCSSSRSLR